MRIELITGTNDAMLAAVRDRRVEAAFVAEVPGRDERLSVLPLFPERVVLISAATHRPIHRAADVQGDSLIAFPSGCAYRRAFEHWLGRKGLTALRVLEMSSYHAIVACVAAGAGIALVPESVLEIVDDRHIVRHSVPRVQETFVTPLVWRTQEASPALVALIESLKPSAARAAHPRGSARALEANAARTTQ